MSRFNGFALFQRPQRRAAVPAAADDGLGAPSPRGSTAVPSPGTATAGAPAGGLNAPSPTASPVASPASPVAARAILGNAVRARAAADFARNAPAPGTPTTTSGTITYAGNAPLREGDELVAPGMFRRNTSTTITGPIDAGSAARRQAFVNKMDAEADFLAAPVLGENAFTNRALAADANRRANDQSGAEVGVKNSVAAVNNATATLEVPSVARKNDAAATDLTSQARERDTLAAPRVRQLDAGTAQTEAQTKEIPANASSQRVKTGAEALATVKGADAAAQESKRLKQENEDLRRRLERYEQQEAQAARDRTRAEQAEKDRQARIATSRNYDARRLGADDKNAPLPGSPAAATVAPAPAGPGFLGSLANAMSNPVGAPPASAAPAPAPTPVSAPQQQAPAQNFVPGQTAVNKLTGQRLQFNGTEWVPVQ